MRNCLKKYLETGPRQWAAILTAGLVAVLLSGMILFNGEPAGLKAAISPIDEVTADTGGSQVAEIDHSRVHDQMPATSGESGPNPQSTGLGGNIHDGTQTGSSPAQQTPSGSGTIAPSANDASSVHQPQVPPPVNTQKNRVKLTIDNGSRTLELPMEVEDGCTVFDLLETASGEYDFSFGYSSDDSYGAFVEELDGVRNSPISGKYWMYLVNGQYASLGASSQTVSDGDVILWRYEATIY